MIFFSLLKGIAIGFLLAMPVGPVGVLCVRRTLIDGARHGFVIGLSGASADILYALVAAFGITLISDFVTGFQHWFRLISGIFLFVVGVYIFRTHPSPRITHKRSNEHPKAFISTFLLALTNPITLFAFVTIFSAIRSGETGSDKAYFSMLVAGVFFGSLSWFSLLIRLTSFFKKDITRFGLIVVNRIAGCLMMLFGAAAIWIGANKF